MNYDEIKDRLKDIKIENFIWIIYIGIIILSYYSNSLEKEYILYNNLNSKEEYRKIIIIIFSILVIVYLYFFISSYNDIKYIDLNNLSEKDYLLLLSFIGSLLILISGIIFLYIAYKDKDINVELAFN